MKGCVGLLFITVTCSSVCVCVLVREGEREGVYMGEKARERRCVCLFVYMFVSSCV